MSTTVVSRPVKTYSRRDYGFESRDPAEEACRATSISIIESYVIGPLARSCDVLALRQSLRERFLTPQEFSVTEYRERLKSQARENTVASMRTNPVGSRTGGFASDDNWLFMS